MVVVAFPSLAQLWGMVVRGAVAAQLLDPLIRLPQVAQAAHWAQRFQQAHHSQTPQAVRAAQAPLRLLAVAVVAVVVGLVRLCCTRGHFPTHRQYQAV